MPIYPADLEKRFEKTDLVGQYVLCKREEYAPAGWVAEQRQGWILAAHPVLPAVGMLTPGGDWFGWLLGYAISADGRLIEDDFTLDLDPDADGFYEAFENAFYELGGRFAAVVFGRNGQRVYLDPAGSLSAVFSPAHEIVCSTPPLVPYTNGCDDDRELIEAMDIPERNSLYAFGLSPRRGVERIQPNHHLDLSTWEPRRHWPGHGLDSDENVETSVSRIIELTKRNIGALAQKYLLHLSLTAGRDSRLLLACAREHLDKISLFTFRLDDSAQLDCDTARLLTRKVGLDLKVLDYVEPSETDLMEWLYRTGCCVGERRGWKIVRTCKGLDPQRAELPGICGETSRLTYWRKWETETSPVDLNELLGRVGVPATPEILRRAQLWLDDLPVTNTLRIIDMMFIEIFLGGWAGLLPYSDPVSTAFRVYPLCQREILERMIRLPTRYRRDQSLTADICRREWPQLLSVPFNEPVGNKKRRMLLEKNLKRAKKAVTRPGLGFRKLKDRLGR